MLALLLLFCMIFALSSCGKTKNEDELDNAISSNKNSANKSIIWGNKDDYLLVESITKKNDEITQQLSYSYNQYGKIESEQLVSFWTKEQIEQLLKYNNTSEFQFLTTRNYLYDDFGIAYKRMERNTSYITNKTTEISSEISCDHNGNIVSISELSGKEPQRWEYNYNDNGNQTYYRYYSNDKLLTSIHTYYNEQGQETNSEKYMFSYNDGFAEEYKYTYTNTDVDKNNVSFKIGYNDKGEEISKVELLYDNNGNIIKEIHYDKGTIETIVEHKYELKENIVKPLQEAIAENEKKMPKAGAYFAEDKSSLLIYNDTEGYYIELNIVGLTHIDGIGKIENEDMIFTGNDANNQPIIIRLKYYENNKKIILHVEDSKWEYLPNGETFSFIKDEEFSTGP